jgi:hypothetical protein
MNVYDFMTTSAIQPAFLTEFEGFKKSSKKSKKSKKAAETDAPEVAETDAPDASTDADTSADSSADASSAEDFGCTAPEEGCGSGYTWNAETCACEMDK